MIMYWSIMDGKEGTTPRSDGLPMTSRSDAFPMSSRSGRGQMESERSFVEYKHMVQDLNHPHPVMTDSYLSRMDSVTRFDDEGTREITQVDKFDNYEQETDRNVQESVRSARKKWPSYLTPPNGLRIITWDEFIEVPDMLNGHFVLEKNGYISHDASKVNVFFHDARMVQTNLGSSSQSGKSWTIFVEDYQELKSVRNWLTERISVLVVTLRNKNPREKDLGSTACCLLAVDPAFTAIQEKIQEAMSTAMESFLRQRQFCIMLDFNSSVERWCEEALHMRCEAEGAKIVITNGDEPPDLYGTNDNICYYFCLPFKYIQGTAYKVRRRSTYDDVEVTFEEEHIMLCTANTRLQAYAEKAQKHAPISSRRVTKKKNTVTFTEGTQTAGDIKTGNGDCGVIDLEDMERGGEDENQSSSRETTIYDRVIKDKDRASLLQDGTKSRDQPRAPKKSTIGYKVQSSMKTKEAVKVDPPICEEATSQMDNTVDDLDESVPEEPVYSSTFNGGVIDVKADVHCATYTLEGPQSSYEPQITYSKVHSDVNAVQTIVNEIDEPVRTSIQTLKLDNYVPDPQFSIDVFDSAPSQVVTEQPLSQSTNISNAKQQKRIDKMLKDIMGPGSVQTKKSSKKGKPKTGVTNAGFLGDLVNGNYDSTNNDQQHHRPRTTDVVPFGRKDAYSTLPLTKPSGRSTSKSADFDESHGHHTNRSDAPISPKKVKKIKKKFQEKDEEKLFTPRFILEKDRNCFSDLDPVDEFTDVDANAAASDNEGLVSSRIISVKNTEKTVSMDSVQAMTDTELEITDCDTEDMSVTSEDTNAHARKKSAKRGQRGQQYDSRRRYLALNSLRRKTKARMLNAEIRNRIRVVKT